MSEFKFACPVCGQHITADSSTSGRQLECPTCFQKIIVPQAPESGDSKLILSATKATGTRTAFGSDLGVTPKKSRLENLKASLAPVLLLVGTGGIAFLLWHNQLTSLANGLAEKAAGPAPRPTPPSAFQSPHPVPSNVSWSLSVSNAPIPNSDVAGRIHGNGFLCEHAVLKAGRLSLRQGASSPPDLAITITLGAREPEELSSKAVVVATNSLNPAPRVVLRWKDDQQQPVTEHIHGGYAMKVIFGPVMHDRVRGRLFIALPDEQKSFAAGNFEAEIIRQGQSLAGK